MFFSHVRNLFIVKFEGLERTNADQFVDRDERRS